ncbi:Berberine bridge enzyme-like 8 [Camellia lanceoleosa]|uniref:Berberine bridge enzyme-like 8 n=1 Tax=Camellia lanceoleosa TaxID=1840588 RepID=A0ACC0GGW7_9ERIC|nr:Berberine bridge enzyme-like 8 [Camellia lanceoleosa]
MTVMNRDFPELGLQKQDCMEMSWIQSVLYWANFDPKTSPNVLLDRTYAADFQKRKSDYVQTPISKTGDLDIGITHNGKDSYNEGKVYGLMYFKGNFDRLVRVKTMVDPQNLFRNEQSIPPFPAKSRIYRK